MKYIFPPNPNEMYDTVLQKLQNELQGLTIDYISPADPFDLVVTVIINECVTDIKADIKDFNRYELLKSKVVDFAIKNRIL